MNKLSPKEIENMPYVQFMAVLDEVNRPPGGKQSVRRAVQNAFLNHKSKVLDVGCNTGYCTFEIAHLSKARVIGIDISPDMIKSAKRYQQNDPLGHLVSFQVSDGMNMSFEDELFDATFSGGSTAFIDDKQKAIMEYIRVTKLWGFVIDINFYYHHKPPKSVLEKLNDLLGIDIQPWGLDYWVNLYESCGLEQYYLFTDKANPVSKKEIDLYCNAIAKEKKYSVETKQAISKRLNDIMTLFNENHKYLSYGVFVNRKRPTREQSALFSS